LQNKYIVRLHRLRIEESPHNRHHHYHRYIIALYVLFGSGTIFQQGNQG